MVLIPIWDECMRVSHTLYQGISWVAFLVTGIGARQPHSKSTLAKSTLTLRLLSCLSHFAPAWT